MVRQCYCYLYLCFTALFNIVPIVSEASDIRMFKGQGAGQIGMLGSIVETPCGIDTSKKDQSIDMGVNPISLIARYGQGKPQPFSIKLVNCRFKHNDISSSDRNYFTVIFDGHSDNGLFALNGKANGVALQLIDVEGNISQPGKPMPIGNINVANTELNYMLKLVSNQQSLRSGTFYTTLRFKIDYY
jgi:P pilus assembly protein, pilin FimA